MGKRYTEAHEVLYYECDYTGKLTIPMMLSLMIKTSEKQSDDLDRGNEYVRSKGLTWVITNYEMKMTRLPYSGEIVQVTTEADTYNKFFCYRKFWLHDAQGGECAFIYATFALMNVESRKMGKVLDEIIAPYGCEKDNKIHRGEKIIAPEAPESKEYRVRYLDIDGNQHVNNAKYLEWMLDVLGFDFLTEHTPEAITIKFDKEVEYGNVIESQWDTVSGERLTSRHVIALGDTVCAEANIHWCNGK